VRLPTDFQSTWHVIILLNYESDAYGMVKEVKLIPDEGVNPENLEIEKWMDEPRTLQPADPIKKIHDMLGQITSLIEKQDFIGANRVFLQAKTLISMGLVMAGQHKNSELKASLEALKELLDERKHELDRAMDLYRAGSLYRMQ
jgi:hypothetical protein